MIKTNKRATETFLVNKVAQTTMPTSGNINSGTFPNVALADGQLGFFSDSMWGSVAMNVSVDATPTIAEAPVLALYQGTADSAAMATATASYPLWPRPYVRSNPIDGRGTVRVTKQPYREPSHNVWVLGNTPGQANDINVLDNTVYSIAIALRSRRVQEAASLEEASVLHASVTSPDFTTLGYTNAEAIDYLTTYLAYNINRNSTALKMNTRFPAKWPVLALLIDTTGTAGVAIGGVDPIAAGDVIPIVNTADGVRSITLTSAMANSIKNAAIEVFGDVIANVTWSIETIDLSEAGEVATSKGELLMIIGLDATTAYTDYIVPVKTRLEIGLTAGFDFNTVQLLDVIATDEGQGLSRQLDLLYKATHGQRLYNLRHTEDPVVEFTSPILDGTTYTVYNILHGRTEDVDTQGLTYSPYREIVCIPSANTTLISTFDTVLNNWLASTPTNGTITTSD